VRPVPVGGILGDGGMTVVPNGNLKATLEAASCVLDMGGTTLSEAVDLSEEKNIQNLIFSALNDLHAAHAMVHAAMEMVPQKEPQA
jgi:hypothetical protein